MCLILLKVEHRRGERSLKNFLLAFSCHDLCVFVLGYDLSLLIISDSKRGFLSVQNIPLWPDNLLIYFDFCFLPLSVPRYFIA